MADEAAVADATTEETSQEESTPQEDWKAHARKHEREAKKLRKELEARDAKLSEIDEASKSAQEKELEKARKEAAEAATAEVTKTFRTQLLNAEIRAQAAGKFANPDLATRVLDIDADDVFGDDGIKKDAISKAVDDFLAQDVNVGLKVDPANGRPSGDADAGRGQSGGSSGSDMNLMLRQAAGRA